MIPYAVFGLVGWFSETSNDSGSPINEDAEVKIIFLILFSLHACKIFSNPIIFTSAFLVSSPNDDTSEWVAKFITTSTPLTVLTTWA